MDKKIFTFTFDLQTKTSLKIKFTSISVDAWLMLLRTEARFYTCSHWLTIFLVVMTTVLYIIVALEFSFAYYKYLKFNLILQFVWSHFNLLSCKQQRDGRMWLKTQRKKVISMVRKWALLYLMLKVKMWSFTVQCKAIATMVIIAGILDTSENIWLNPSLLTKLGRTHSLLS